MQHVDTTLVETYLLGISAAGFAVFDPKLLQFRMLETRAANILYAVFRYWPCPCLL
jgi:hypothetical protein